MKYDINTKSMQWLKNGIIACTISSLYSMILMVSGIPQLSRFFTTNDFFFQSIFVTYVNLSILVWLLSIVSMIWSLNKYKTGLEYIYSTSAFLGILLISLSPFCTDSFPVINHHVQILENIVFIVGITLFGIGTLLFALQTVCTSFILCFNEYGTRLIAIFNFTSSLMFILVWICFIISYAELLSLLNLISIRLDFYYEMIFWSGRHLLQFIYTQLLMIVLLILLETWKSQKIKFSLVYETLLALNFFLSLSIIFGHVKFNLVDSEFKEFYTLHMIYAGRISPTLFIIMVYIEVFQCYKQKITSLIPQLFLISSSALFLYGNFIGISIHRSATTVHYHYGTEYSTSIALMGLSYLVCFSSSQEHNTSNHLGIASKIFIHINKNSLVKKITKILPYQVVFLTLGQLLHITDLALSGGNSMIIKFSGVEKKIHFPINIDIIAVGEFCIIVSGLVFSYICIGKLYFPKKIK